MSPALNGAGGIRDEVNANEEQHLVSIEKGKFSKRSDFMPLS